MASLDNFKGLGYLFCLFVGSRWRSLSQNSCSNKSTLTFRLTYRISCNNQRHDNDDRFPIVTAIRSRHMDIFIRYYTGT